MSDRGVRGVVLKLEGCLGRAEFHGEEAVAGAGVSLSALIREAAALNLGGIECLVGMPATVGGAVAMNAGTPGRRHRRTSSPRSTSCIPTAPSASSSRGRAARSATTCSRRRPSAVLIGARLQLHRRPFAEIQKDIKQRLKQKKSTQPLALASAGCVWKNPPGETATRLIEKVGLKGKRLNGAEISAKHANFIVNRGGATAADIKALMELTLDRVQQPLRHHARARDPDRSARG